MKWWKYSVFFVLVMVLGLIGTDVRTQAGIAYAKEEQSTPYVLTSEDTIVIYQDNFNITDPAVRKQFEKVKNINLECDSIYFDALSWFPNAETLSISKNMISLTYLESRDQTMPKLKTITVDEENPLYGSFDGALYTQSLHKLLFYPPNAEKEVKISPKTQVIGMKAFFNVPIASIEIPEGIRTIERQAFAGTKLREISLPAGFRKIEKEAFLNTPLTKVTIAKDNASLTSVDGVLFSKDKTYLYYWPEQKTVENLILPDELEYLDCSIIPTFNQVETITIPRDLTAIGHTEKNHLSQVILPKENKNFCLYDGVLYSSNEKQIRLYPNNNPDADIVIDPLLEQFPMQLFYEDNTTKTLTLPKGLTTLEGTRAWQKVLLGGFTNLSELKFDGVNPNFTLTGGVLYNKDQTVLLWYPADLEQKVFAIPNTVTLIENDQLAKQNYLEKLIIPADCMVYDYSPFWSEWETYYEMPVGKYCKNLKGFDVAEQSELYSVQDGVLFSKDMTRLLSYPCGKKDKSYQIPDTVLEAPFGNANPYLEILTLSASVRSIASDMAIEMYDYSNKGLLSYSALRDIKVDTKNRYYVAKDGVLYRGSDLYIYPVGKTDADFYLPKETVDIQNVIYLENSPYLTKIYVTSGGRCNDIIGKQLWLSDARQMHSFEKIVLISK